MALLSARMFSAVPARYRYIPVPKRYTDNERFREFTSLPRLVVQVPQEKPFAPFWSQPDHRPMNDRARQY